MSQRFVTSRHVIVCADTNCRREDYYATIKDDPELHVKLTGSWEVVVGDQDTFCTPPTRVLSLSALTQQRSDSPHPRV